jgi:hypothetical protein
MHLQEQIAQEFNDCIQAARVKYTIVFTKNDIVLTDNRVTTADTVHIDSLGLSHFFFQNCFPQNPWTEYHHFTHSAN